MKDLMAPGCLIDFDESPFDCSRVSKTIQILVEDGESDPMIANANGDTSLHLHTGSIDQFQYLLDQQLFPLDPFKSNSFGDTVAEYHARGFWPEGPERARLAYERELEFFWQRHSRSEIRFPASSQVVLLHELASHLSFHVENETAFENSLYLVQTLVMTGANIHAVFRGNPSYGKTPLAMLPTIARELECPGSEQELKSRAKSLNDIFYRWLVVLDEVGINLRTYLEEELRVLSKLKAEDSWEIYEFNESWE
ncbi:MAG: hypothetical protein MMC33_001091 [Icmadophila ericetorum]|nr:hypothetical protein [Icmadophila ericetorum]